MSDDAVRPRRALAPDDSAPGTEPAEAHVENPFARPGSEASQQPPPTARRGATAEDLAAFQGSDDETIIVPRVDAEPMIPAPVLPERENAFPDDASPKPRRSALSSSTPAPAPGAEDAVGADPSAPLPDQPQEATAVAPTPQAGTGWFEAHRPKILAAGAVVAVLAVGAGVLGYTQGRSVGGATASPSPSPSSSASVAIPRVSQTDLLDQSDVKAISADATWAITGTTTTPDEHTARAACLSTEGGGADRLDSLQRLFGTTNDNQLAVLHQLDSYPTQALAEATFKERAQALATCAEIQTLVLSSATVSGLGDESMQITVVEEGERRKHHTLLLTRTGNILSLVDVAQDDAAVEPLAAVKAVTRSATTICESAGDCAPQSAKVEAGQVPAAEPKGWLIPSDLPRVRAGAGLWTSKSPAALVSPGTGCENLTLASESGPTERQQATYLVTQDDQAPTQFGLDEMVFRFADENNAANFATKLQQGLAGCKDRVLGTEAREINVGEGPKAFEILRKTDQGEVVFQVSVVRNGTDVAYLLATVTKSYKFTDEHLRWLTQRASLRLGQD